LNVKQFRLIYLVLLGKMPLINENVRKIRVSRLPNGSFAHSNGNTQTVLILLVALPAGLRDSFSDSLCAKCGGPA